MTHEEVILQVIETGKYEHSPQVNLDRIHQILSDGECSDEMKTAKKFLEIALNDACSDLNTNLVDLLKESSFSDNIRMAAFTAMMRRAEKMKEVNDEVEFLMLYCLCKMLDEVAAQKPQVENEPGVLTGYLTDMARGSIRAAEAHMMLQDEVPPVTDT